MPNTVKKRAKRTPAAKLARGRIEVEQSVNGVSSHFSDTFGDLTEVTNPARVGMSVAVNSSANYQSVKTMVYIEMPVAPTPSKVAEMKAWVAKNVRREVEKEHNKSREGLGV
jgi:hypothetical protein